MSEIPQLPRGTPKRARKIYIWVVTIAAFLGAIAYIFRQIPLIRDGLHDMCQTTRICGPAPLKEMQPLASGYEKGNTVARAASAQFEQYARENPDWEICIKDTRSLPTHDAFNTNYRYRMEGTFYGVPKWRGLTEVVSDYWANRDYVKQTCNKS